MTDVGQRLHGYADTSQQRELLGRLVPLYREQGVLDGWEARSLHRACPDAGPCWAACRDRIREAAEVELGPGEDGSIFFPWVGASYRPGGVCSVGWNLNDDGPGVWYSLLQEFVIAEGDADRLAAGYHRSKWGSEFAYRSLASTLAIADSLDGAPPIEAPDPETLSAGMERIARVQAVKCAPVGERGNPSSEMNLRCPSRFLLRELDVLRPRALVVFGDKALDPVAEAIEAADGFGPFVWHRKYNHGYGRGTAPGPWGEPLTVFALWHPSYTGWSKAQAQLVADLATQPLDRSI